MRYECFIKFHVVYFVVNTTIFGIKTALCVVYSVSSIAYAIRCAWYILYSVHAVCCVCVCIWLFALALLFRWLSFRFLFWVFICLAKLENRNGSVFFCYNVVMRSLHAHFRYVVWSVGGGAAAAVLVLFGIPLSE